jgi:hypothetical protein
MGSVDAVMVGSVAVLPSFLSVACDTKGVEYNVCVDTRRKFESGESREDDALSSKMMLKTGDGACAYS